MKKPESARLRKFLDELREYQDQFLNCSVVEVNTRGYTGDSPLKIAVVRQDLEIVSDLLDAGADPNVQGEDNCTPLHHAASGDSEEIVRLLLTHGASPSIADFEGSTPIDYVLSHKSIRDLLAEKTPNQPPDPTAFGRGSF